jgi:hypothetical protein
MSDFKDQEKFNVYFSSFPSCQYVFKSGKVAPFVGGRYTTKIQSEITELDHEISEGHPHIYVKKGMETAVAADLDPLSAIKKRAVEEYLAAQAKALDPTNDMGSTVAAKGAGQINTSGIAMVTAGSKSK